MRPIKTLLIGLLLALLCPAAPAQEREFVEYHKADGLPTDYMNFHLLEDSRGYIWGGTRNGSYRFDGNRFMHYTVRNGLPDRVVLRHSEGADGRVWGLSMRGELFWYERDSVRLMPIPEELEIVIRRGHCTSFQVDSSGTFHFQTKRRGYWTYDGQKVTPVITRRSGLVGIGVMRSKHGPPTVFIIAPGRVTTPTSLYLFDHDGSLITEFPEAVPARALNYQNPNVVGFPDSSYLVACGTDLIRFDRQRIQGHLHWSGSTINSLDLTQDGDVMAATDLQGLLEIENGQPDSTRLFMHRPHHDGYLWAMEDHTGGWWMSSASDGLHYSAYPDVRLFHNQNSDLPCQKLGALLYRNGTLYLTSPTGQVIRYDGHQFELLGDMAQETGLSGHRPNHLSWDPAADLPLASMETRLFTVTPSGLREVPRRDTIGPHGLILKMREDPSGEFTWIMSQRRLLKMANGEFLETTPKMPDYMRCMTIDPSGEVWLGGHEGLWKYQNGQIIHYDSDHPLVNSRISDLVWHEGRMWIRNVNLGIGFVEANGEVTYPDQTDIPFETIYNLHSRNGEVWSNANNGLMRMSYDGPGTYKATYRKVLNDRSAGSGMLAIGDDFIYLASDKGLYRINRATAFKQESPPRIHLNRLRINDRDTALLPVYNLPYDQNFLRIGFEGISFTSRRVVYRYKLHGFDREWQNTAEPGVQYTRLPPGDYRFEVRARNIEGNWSDIPAGFRLIIRPPFWETWWFRLLAGIAVISAIVGLFVFLQRRNARRFRLDKRMTELELTALRAQMNPHFTFNTITGVQHYIGRLQPDLAQDYLAKFARLMRTILEHADRETILLEEEVNALKLYLELESLRFEGRFHYRLEVAPELDPDYEQIPPLIIQPFVENAVYHGLLPKEDPGTLAITLSTTGDHLRVRVEDDGIGREAARKRKQQNSSAHPSKGLSITRERLELLHQKWRQTANLEIIDLKNDSGQAIGTRIEFTIPRQ